MYSRYTSHRLFRWTSAVAPSLLIVNKKGQQHDARNQIARWMVYETVGGSDDILLSVRRSTHKECQRTHGETMPIQNLPERINMRTVQSRRALQPAAAGLGVSVVHSDLAKPRLGRVPVGEIFGVDGWSY